MNKYAALGLLMAGVVDGKHVLVVTTPHRAVRSVLDEFLPMVPPDAEVRRANGAERIRLASGATIRIVTPAGMRGYAADVVYIEADVAREGLDEVAVYDARAVVAGSPHGEIVRA